VQVRAIHFATKELHQEYRLTIEDQSTINQQAVEKLRAVDWLANELIK